MREIEERGVMVKMDKCQVCGKAPISHGYDGLQLCEYDYWVRRGRIKTGLFRSMFFSYTYFHPIRVRKWAEKDPELKEMMKDYPQYAARDRAMRSFGVSR